MKIAFVANSCWNIYNFRKGLVHHFLERQHEVIVLAPQDAYTAAIKGWGIRFIETPIEGTSTHPLKDLAYCYRLLRIFQREKPMAALCFTIKPNIYASLAGSIAGVKVICNVSGLGTVFLVKGLAGKIAIGLYRLAFRFSKFIFFQNESDRDLFTSRIKVKKDRLGVLPGSGINLFDFQPEAMPERKEVQFLMVSRLIVEKGVREFAEAAMELAGSDVKFTLMGRLDESHARTVSRAELENWKQNGITYLEHSSRVKEVVAAHDAVILPSYREGTSRTLLEAAAMARPLLASDVPGCREVVLDGENGFLFEARNATAIVEKCRLFLALSREERALMARNSRQLAENVYDERIVINRYVEVLHQMGVPT